MSVTTQISFNFNANNYSITVLYYCIVIIYLELLLLTSKYILNVYVGAVVSGNVSSFFTHRYVLYL